MAQGNHQKKHSDAKIEAAIDEFEGDLDKVAESLRYTKRALHYRIYGNKNRKNMKPNQRLQDALETWREIKVKRLETSVLERALTSDTLAIFTLKAQAGWKDGRELTLQGPNGGAVPIAIISEADWNAI